MAARVRAAAAIAAALAWVCPAALADPAVISRSADGHAVVELSTGTGVLRLALDTGADTSALTGEAIARLGLAPAPSGRAALTALTGETPVDRYTLPDAQLGGLDLPEIWPAALAHAPDSQSELDGFLGLDALAGQSWRIDLAANRLEPVAPVTCAPGTHLLPAVEGVINGRAVLVMVDTGLAGSVGNTALGRQLSRLQGPATRTNITGADGARIPVRLMRARSLRMGDVLRRNAEIAVADLSVFEALDLSGQPALFAGMDLLDASIITLTVTADAVCIEIGAP